MSRNEQKEQKPKRTRRRRIRKSLSGVDELLGTKYFKRQLFNRLQASNCSKGCLADMRDKTMDKLKDTVSAVARNVQEKMPQVVDNPVVASMDAYANMATAQEGKKVSNFELPIILKGIHEIYQFPEMQDQTPLDVRNLYSFLHFLTMGQPAPALEESSLVVLREAFNELMEEVNSDESTAKVKQLEELIKNRRPLEAGENDDMQHILHEELNLRDLGINLFQMPPEMLNGSERQ